MTEGQRVVGLKLRDLWDYDFVRPWVDKSKIEAAVKEFLIELPEYDHEQSRHLILSNVKPDEIQQCNRQPPVCFYSQP